MAPLSNGNEGAFTLRLHPAEAPLATILRPQDRLDLCYEPKAGATWTCLCPALVVLATHHDSAKAPEPWLVLRAARARFPELGQFLGAVAEKRKLFLVATDSLGRCGTPKVPTTQRRPCPDSVPSPADSARAARAAVAAVASAGARRECPGTA